jgi:hypothetical protein
LLHLKRKGAAVGLPDFQLTAFSELRSFAELFLQGKLASQQEGYGTVVL